MAGSRGWSILKLPAPVLSVPAGRRAIGGTGDTVTRAGILPPHAAAAAAAIHSDAVRAFPSHAGAVVAGAIHTVESPACAMHGIGIVGLSIHGGTASGVVVAMHAVAAPTGA